MINSEDAVRAAITLEKWCMDKGNQCDDCPFFDQRGDRLYGVCMVDDPGDWDLEEFLRKRGMKE